MGGRMKDRRNDYTARQRADAIDLRKKGYGYTIIGKRLGVKASTVNTWVRSHEKYFGVKFPPITIMTEQKEQIQKLPEKPCLKCKYRARDGKYGCNYILLEKHSRGCSPYGCTKFVKGKRLMLRDELEMETDE